MPQQNNKVANEARKVLENLGLPTDDKIIAALQEVVLLKAGPAPADTPRDIKLIIHSDKSVEATQENLNNLVRFNLRDLKDAFSAVDKTIGAVSAAAGFLVPGVAFYAAALNLFLVLHGMTKHVFHKSDAAVLYIIDSLDKKPFLADEVKEAYLQRYKSELPDDEWALSLSNFIEYNVLVKLNNGKFKLMEDISFDRG
jgi:antitoxin component of RelBE/YafQ-DinJ toxin-antitoxin module